MTARSSSQTAKQNAGFRSPTHGYSAIRPLTPTLESERLVLRGHRPDDLGDCVAMWADSSVTRHIGGSPSSQERTWLRMLAYAGHWTFMDFGYWVVRERSNGRFVGEVGFADFKRAIEPSIAGVPEIGWALAASQHGKGFATEAVRTALRWGDEHLAATRTVCLITPENDASLRVAEKCGYREIHRVRRDGNVTLVFQRDVRRVGSPP